MNAPTLVELQPFQSHAALRAEHLELLKDFTNDGESVSYAPRIKEFIQRGVAAGVYLDRDADRRSAQSVLDYWGTRLYRLTEEEVGSRLLDFDFLDVGAFDRSLRIDSQRDIPDLGPFGSLGCDAQILQT